MTRAAVKKIKAKQTNFTFLSFDIFKLEISHLLASDSELFFGFLFWLEVGFCNCLVRKKPSFYQKTASAPIFLFFVALLSASRDSFTGIKQFALAHP